MKDRGFDLIRRRKLVETAKTVGMLEKFAQQALRHSSKAFVRAYSKKARVVAPSLEDCAANVVPLAMAVNQ
jgi:hypothetical protein